MILSGKWGQEAAGPCPACLPRLWRYREPENPWMWLKNGEARQNKSHCSTLQTAATHPVPPGRASVRHFHCVCTFTAQAACETDVACLLQEGEPETPRHKGT